MDKLQEMVGSKIDELFANHLLVRVTPVTTRPTVVPPVVKETKKRASLEPKKSISRKKSKIQDKSTDGTEEVVALVTAQDETLQSSSPSNQSSTLLRVGFDEVFKRLRHEAVVNVTKQRVGDLGARVVEIILDKSMVSSYPFFMFLIVFANWKSN